MAETRFTAIGMTGSGKTCYVLGMYYEMCVGIKGFSLVTKNQTASLLEDWMDKLDDVVGKERFPAGTSLTDVRDFYFQLNYQNQEILSFNWMDYGGRTLTARENNPDAFKSLNNSIKESTALYIFIDGELLAVEDHEKRLSNVRRKMARTINGYITEFEHSNGEEIPPIVFVITKADLCASYLEEGEMQDIIKECFSPVFGNGKRVYIVDVSLGKDISDDDYSGEVKPMNIHIPFFLGIYHEFYNFCVWLKYKIDEEIGNNRRDIVANQAIINKENNRFFSFMRNDSAVSNSRTRINEAERNIASKEAELKKQKRLLGAVAAELDRMSNKFITFVDGKETEFNHDEIYEF